MSPETILNCARSYAKLIGTQYIIHIGRGGKHSAFIILIEKEDFHHLMGLHYLSDRFERRNRERIFDDILSSEQYRAWLSTSEMWNHDLEMRVACTSVLPDILDDNGTIIRYNPKRLTFYSTIKSEYLFSHTDYELPDLSENPISPSNRKSDIYLFIDKREYSEYRFCKSIFPKKDRDFTESQAIWHLLYKEKIAPDKSSSILYKHNDYDPSELLQIK